MLAAIDLDRLIADTEQEMLGVIERAEDERTRELYRMVRYHMGLDSDAPRGKRMRPLIGLLAYQSIAGDHAKALPGNPYDGHTLRQAIEGTEALTGREIERAYVDKGYQGHDAPKPLRVFKSGQKRGVHGQIKKELRRRSAIEAGIGHCKTDGHLGRNFLKGRHGSFIFLQHLFALVTDSILAQLEVNLILPRKHFLGFHLDFCLLEALHLGSKGFDSRRFGFRDARDYYLRASAGWGPGRAMERRCRCRSAGP